jgi:hypothetical protein
VLGGVDPQTVELVLLDETGDPLLVLFLDVGILGAVVQVQVSKFKLHGRNQVLLNIGEGDLSVSHPAVLFAIAVSVLYGAIFMVIGLKSK